MQDKIREYIQGINQEFIEINGGSFVKLSTGESFTSSEVKRYTQIKIEKYMKEIQEEIRKESDKESIPYEQRIINDRSLEKSRNKKNKSKKTKDRYDGGEFNISYKNNKVWELINMKMNNNEKLVYYIIRELIVYPYNCVMINDNIPKISDLAPIVGLSDKSIRNALKTLQVKNVIKLKQAGHRKAIYINPEYFASGKDLGIEVLQMFGLVDIDEDKLNDYLD